ncbi:hypothetical protein GC194_13875 [bacterium]|nr:hypothetical protein [bacterium]
MFVGTASDAMTYENALKIFGLDENYGLIELKAAAREKFKLTFEKAGLVQVPIEQVYWAYEMLHFFHNHSRLEVELDMASWHLKEADLTKPLNAFLRLDQRQFLRSKYYKRLNVLGNFFDSLAFILLLGSCALPWLFGTWKGTVGYFVGIIGWMVVFFSCARYFTGIKGFRWGRARQNFGVMFRTYIFWATLLMVVQVLLLPSIVFRFVVPTVPLLVVYIGLAIITRALVGLFGAKGGFFTYLLPMGIVPSVLSLYFLLGLVKTTPLPDETYSFTPFYTRFGTEAYMEPGAVLYLQNNAYENEVGIRIFANKNGFKKDSICLHFSETLLGHKHLDSWDFK